VIKRDQVTAGDPVWVVYRDGAVWLVKIDGIKGAYEMQVKIGDAVYNSEEQPIMVVLSDEEKELIANMSGENHRFCSYPEKYSPEEIRLFMRL